MKKSIDELRKPRTLIENRISFAGPNAELSVYDTYLPATEVALSAGELLYCGMISGKKILRGTDDFSTEFLPHESFVMLPGENIEIDFPAASIDTPTSCLTIEISTQRIDHICSHLNKIAPLQKGFDDWHYREESVLHTTHTHATQSLLERLISTFTENSTDRDILIDLGISELVVRMLREQTRGFLLKSSNSEPDASGLNAVLDFIQSHIDQALHIDQLCKIACMSRSRFFTEFKHHLGCTPMEFQQQVRMKLAGRELKTGKSVTKVCFDLGFQNLSHFSRRFNQQYGLSPKQYQQQFCNLKSSDSFH